MLPLETTEHRPSRDAFSISIVMISCAFAVDCDDRMMGIKMMMITIVMCTLTLMIISDNHDDGDDDCAGNANENSDDDDDDGRPSR